MGALVARESGFSSIDFVSLFGNWKGSFEEVAPLQYWKNG